MKNLIELYFHFNFHHLQMKSRENVLMKVNNFFMVFTKNLYQEQKSVNNHVKTISFNLRRGFCDTYSFVKIHTHTHTHTPNKYHTEQKKLDLFHFMFALYLHCMYECTEFTFSYPLKWAQKRWWYTLSTDTCLRILL